MQKFLKNKNLKMNSGRIPPHNRRISDRKSGKNLRNIAVQALYKFRVFFGENVQNPMIFLKFHSK
jgi:hypothetical protein